jgi:hypothetical protein
MTTMARSLEQRIDAIGSDAQRVDIQSRVHFVENAQARLKQRHLQHFVALLFATGKPDVDAALEHIHRNVERGRNLANFLQKVRHKKLGLATRLTLSVQRRAQKVHGGDARNFHRILEREEYALVGALVRRHLEQVFALEQDFARSHVITRLARDDVRKRRFAGTVRPHDGVNFALIHDEVETMQDLVIFHLNLEAFDFKQRGHLQSSRSMCEPSSTFIFEPALPNFRPASCPVTTRRRLNPRTLEQ